MADYGTLEWYKELLEKKEFEKQVYINALENISRTNIIRHECINNGSLDLIEKIAESIIGIKRDIYFYKREIEKLQENKE